MPKDKIVKVIWLDASSNNEWSTMPDILDWIEEMKEEETITIGFFIKEDKDAMVVAASKDYEGKYNDINFIPKGCVIKVVPLHERN